MRWYDLFAHTYDAQLEGRYRPYRAQAVAALEAQPGDVVLDLACGTGQNFDGIEAAIGPTGRILGVDLSKGMLAKAKARAEKAGWANVTLIEANAELVGPALVGTEQVDRVIVALGLTAIPNWERAFQGAWALLRPGGRFVILDVYAEKRTLQTWLVELLARAHLDRLVWTPLEVSSIAFERHDTGASPREFGGTLFVASGTKGEGS